MMRETETQQPEQLQWPLTERAHRRVKKIGRILASSTITKKLLHPQHLLRMASLARQPIRRKKAAADAQLKLYAEIFSKGCLHYGYFDDPAIPPEEISIGAIGRAQHRYEELILELIKDHESPVLDVGCGMGNLIRLLRDRGFSPSGVTPDQYQCQYLHEAFPDLPFFHSKFEEMPYQELQQSFGTIINSESLQYIKLDTAVLLVKQLLKPGGRWIVIDYFKKSSGGRRSGHHWEDFVRQLDEHGMTITFERDITPHVLPTLAFVHFLGSRFGLPLATFASEKMKAKRPALAYLLEEVVTMGRESLVEHIEAMNPKTFANEKKYLLLSIE